MPFLFGKNGNLRVPSEHLVAESVALLWLVMRRDARMTMLPWLLPLGGNFRSRWTQTHVWHFCEAYGMELFTGDCVRSTRETHLA